MKILTVVGARPQFIKAAVVSHELRKNHTEILVHTGQHFDYNMSQLFFEELNIPSPDYNLGISGGSHAEMTGSMMIAIEKVLKKESPDWLLVYGDTNSTLAAALAAAKLHIKICHVEAGNRTHCKNNPEEINRICTDHISSLLLTSVQSALKSLQDEGIKENVYMVGNTMYDAFREYSEIVKIDDIKLHRLDDGSCIHVPSEFYYLTCHREENTNDDNSLLEIFKAMNSLDSPTVYPVHPRNKNRALKLKLKYNFCNLILCEPVGYLESLCLVKNSKKIVTDSGGLQTEAFFARKKCVTILNFVCWPETMVDFRNELSLPCADDILNRLKNEQHIDPSYEPFGDGYAAKLVVKKLEDY